MTGSVEAALNHIPASSLRLDIFSQILKAIFLGDLPEGTRLKVLHLAKQYGTSSTPVREAIVELSGLGVVEMIPNRGAVVAPLGVVQVREIYHVRKILEVDAIRSACECPNLETIEKLLEETVSLQKEEQVESWAARCVEVDQGAHVAIMEAAGNSRLKAELIRYGRLMHMVRLMLRDREFYNDQILAEHKNFLQALVIRDKETAGNFLAQHLDATCHRVLKGIFPDSIIET